MTQLDPSMELPQRVSALVHFLTREGRGAGLERDDVLVLFAVGANPHPTTELGTVLRMTGLDDLTGRRRAALLVERGFLRADEPTELLQRLRLGATIAA